MGVIFPSLNLGLGHPDLVLHMFLSCKGRGVARCKKMIWFYMAGSVYHFRNRRVFFFFFSFDHGIHISLLFDSFLSGVWVLGLKGWEAMIYDDGLTIMIMMDESSCGRGGGYL